MLYFGRKSCTFSANFRQNAILQLLLPERVRQKEKLIFIQATGGHFGKPEYFGEKFVKNH
jgi:hypothetical protein